MIVFREVDDNVFELDKDTLNMIYTPNNVIDRMKKSGETRFESSDNHKGANCKFWISNKDIKEGLLFKYSKYRNKDEEQQRATFYGELIVDMICFYNNIPHTGYYPCCIIMKNGEVLKGSLSTNYKQGKYDMEYSGENINTRYRQSQYDNNNGKIDHIEYNTVYEYIKQLEYLYPHRLDKDKIEEMKDYLLKIAVLDFLTLQKDRHWGNLGFMANQIKGIKSLTYIPVFDSECCFCLDEPLSTIEAYSQIVRNNKNPYSRLIRPMANSKSNVPLLGIKRTLVDNDISNRLVYRKFKKDEEQSNYEIFLEDLVEELNKNPKLMAFYKNLKEFDLKGKMLQVGYFPDAVIDIAPELYKERINMIEKALEKQRSEENENKS